MRIRPRVLASVLAVSLIGTSTAGCFGSFAATRWIWNFNKDISGNKFIQWLVFLVLVIIPVYEIGGLIDIWILNSLEFWFGGGGTSAADGSDERVVELDGGRWMHMKRDDAAQTMTVTVHDGEVARTVTMEVVGNGMRMLDGTGAVIGAVRDADDGGLEVVDGWGQVLADVDADTVREATQEWEQGGAASVAAFAARQAATAPVARR